MEVDYASDIAFRGTCRRACTASGELRGNQGQAVADRGGACRERLCTRSTANRRRGASILRMAAASTPTGGSSGISSIANVFQAKAGNGNGEALGEVVLATYSDGGSYSIQIYTNLKDKSNPVSGTPAYANPVTFYQKHAGVSTVEVPEVNLMNGTLYSVVLTNIGSDTVEYLCETNSAYDWVEFQAGLEADQSFCSVFNYFMSKAG